MPLNTLRRDAQEKFRNEILVKSFSHDLGIYTFSGAEFKFPLESATLEKNSLQINVGDSEAIFPIASLESVQIFAHAQGSLLGSMTYKIPEDYQELHFIISHWFDVIQQQDEEMTELEFTFNSQTELSFVELESDPAIPEVIEEEMLDEFSFYQKLPNLKDHPTELWWNLGDKMSNHNMFGKDDVVLNHTLIIENSCIFCHHFSSLGKCDYFSKKFIAIPYCRRCKHFTESTSKSKEWNSLRFDHEIQFVKRLILDYPKNTIFEVSDFQTQLPIWVSESAMEAAILQLIDSQDLDGEPSEDTKLTLRGGIGRIIRKEVFIN